MALAERSKLYIDEYVEKKKVVHGVQDPGIPIFNTREFASVVCSVLSVERVDEFARSTI